MASKSRQFNNTDEFFTRADSATLSTGDIDWTWAGWGYLDSNDAGILCGKATSAANREGVLWFDSATRRGVMRIYNAAGTASGSANSLIYITPGRWYFYVGYHDATNNLVGISINGGPFVTSATTDVPSDTTAAFGIGAHFTDGVPALHWGGRICRVGFWKGRILTADECMTLYNNGVGHLYSTLPSALLTNLTCYWNLDETSGDATDSVGSQTLTDTNTVTSGDPPGDAVAGESLYTWTPSDVECLGSVAASNLATITSRGSSYPIPVLAFDDTTNEYAVFGGILPRHYGGNGCQLVLTMACASATSGVCHMAAAFENELGIDLDADSFASSVAGSANVPANAGTPFEVIITFANNQMDAVTGGTPFRLLLNRNTSGANDHTGDAHLICAELIER